MEPWRLITQLDALEWICLPFDLSEIRLAFQRRLDQAAKLDDQRQARSLGVRPAVVDRSTAGLHSPDLVESG